MGKSYEDLSRRALIKLGHDYDQESDAALLGFLTENGEEYENVRPIEKVIERVDNLKETAAESGSVIKQTLISESDKVLDKVIDILTNTADMLDIGKD